MWLPPGVGLDEQVVAELIQETFTESEQGPVFGILEQMGSFEPEGPHWSLAVIAVDTLQQGNGVGSTLLKHTLNSCDRDKTPAYVMSSNLRNLSFYERHGFEAIGEIQAGTSTTVWPMLRKPR